LWATFLCFPLSVFFFAAALKYLKLQQHLHAPIELRLSRETLDKSLRASRVRLVVWILIFLSPLYGAVILMVATVTQSSSLSLLVSTLLVAGLLCVSGFFASVLEFNNNRALSIMLDWALVEPISETEAPTL
jgi:VIT1/CCC1 family predicted Fe2+/Mn2+ transporter